MRGRLHLASLLLQGDLTINTIGLRPAKISVVLPGKRLAQGSVPPGNGQAQLLAGRSDRLRAKLRVQLRTGHLSLRKILTKR
jgi:hypothetical protein